ncbi:MAG: maleate cis-trans isomerase, partial [Ignisphaera sp.]
IKGVGYDEEIIELIKKVSGGCQATTTSTAVVRALKTLGAKKLVVGSPYEEWLNSRLKVFLEGHGFSVIRIKGLGITKNIADIPDNAVYKLVREIYSPEADVIFLSCTDFMTAHLISMLEEDFGMPVITSNQATLWDMLRQVGLKIRIRGYGVLLEKY